MVPTDYRLDHVVARLIERLEGQRPSYAERPEAAPEAFARTAQVHVDAALQEMLATGWADDPEGHAAFLRREVLETFLPRYTALAVRMSRDEGRGYGFGPLAEPIGRLGTVVGALLFLWFVLLKLIYLPIVWPLVLIDLSVPFWPDIAAWLYRRRHIRQLEAIVDDMTRIQDQQNAYLSAGALRQAEEPPRPRPRQSQTEG